MDSKTKSTARAFMIGGGTKFKTEGAENFGKRVELFDESARHFKTEEFFEMLNAKLVEHKYDPEKDFFVLTGNINKIALAVAFVAANYAPINLLLWNELKGEYENRIIPCLEED